MHQICLLAVAKGQEEFPSLHRAMRLLFTSHGSTVWILAVGRVYASTTFANKLETCNVKLERLCEKPQRLKTDLCDIPLLEDWETRLPLMSHKSMVQTSWMARASSLATFANKLETCNVKLKPLWGKNLLLRTDVFDSPLLE